MRCPKCGASSRVIETREEDARTTLRRRRLCQNGHRFNTYEVNERVLNCVSADRRAKALGTTLRDFERYARDLRVWKACQLEGIKQMVVALQEGLAESAVWLANRRFPRLNPEHAKRLEEEHGRSREAGRGGAGLKG